MYVKAGGKLLLFFSLLGLIFSHVQAQTPVTFTSAKFNGRKLTFLLYKPAGYKVTDRIPLLVYLHGSGSVGTDIQKVKEQGIPKLIEEGTKIPYLVAVPQLPPDMNNRWDPAFVNEFFAHIFFYYKIDRSRVYLTGYSMGGTGVWDYATAYPKNITCAVPIAGWGDKEKVCSMKDVPVWAFHGTKDVTVDPTGSRNLVAALQNCKGKATLTEIQNGDHDIWRQAYTWPGLMLWINMNTKRVLAPVETKGVKPTTTKTLPNKVITYKLPVALKDITGMIAGDNGELYGVSANSRPLIIKFDTAARVDRLIKVNGVPNLSWSEMATADNGYVYIADAGNENFKRKFFQVYKVKYADLQNSEAVDATKIEFTLPAGLSLDLRTIFVIGGEIYLLGADQSKVNMLIRIEDRSEQQVATLVARCDNLKQFAITSSRYNPVRKQLTVLDGEKLGIIDLSGGIAALSKKQPSVIRLAFKSKKEAMTEFGGRLLLADQPMQGAAAGNLYSVPNQ